MADYPGLRHLVALVLLGVAGVLYYLGFTVPTGILVFIGLVVEMTAWVTLFGDSSSDSEDRS